MKITFLNQRYGYHLLCLCVCWVFTSQLSWAEDLDRSQSTTDIEQQTSEVQILVNLADDNIQQGQYELALNSLTRAYDLSKALQDSEISNNVLNSIANVYFNTGQYEQAHRYYSELITLDEASGNQETLAVSLFNLGHVNATQKNYLDADSNFERSLAITRQLDDVSGTAYTLKALGVNAQAQSNIEMAQTYLKEALQLFETLDDAMQAAAVHRHLGDIAQIEKQFEQAVHHYETALPVLASNGFNIALLRTYRGMSTAYEQVQNYKKAFISQRAYTQLLQQQLEQQNKETTQRLQVQFETQQFSDANKRLELLNKSQQQELQHRQQLLKMQYIVIALTTSIIILIAIFWWRSRQHAHNMQKLATLDDLTGLKNRRAILEYGMQEWQRSDRFNRPICCLLFDIDHFKGINDTFGHAAGDDVLKSFSNSVKSSLRKTDAFGRFGGEEFLLIATETDIKQAEVLAERIRQEIEGIHHEDLNGRNVTVSIGIVQLTDEQSLEDLIAHADLALYQAKDSGRNKAVVFQHKPESN